MFKSEGIVLRTRNLGEADKIVTLYTKARGKVVSAARGARRVRNRLLGPTQVFTLGRYLIFEGKSLATLSQGEIIESFQWLRDDLELMAWATYLTELVDELVEEGEAVPELFPLLLGSFKMLGTPQALLGVRFFELRLMQCLGYRPQLYECISCGAVPEKNVFFSREGGIICEQCRGKAHPVAPLSLGTWELAKKLLEWEQSRLSILHPSPASLRELETVLRSYIDFRLDRPLKSLGFLHTLEQLQTKEVK